MEGVRAYLLAVTTAALLCGLVKVLGKTTGQESVIQLLCGLFLLFTAASPLARFDPAVFSDWIPQTQLQAQAAVDAGMASANLALAERIKQETQAYILDKAEDWGAELQVEVHISRSQPPVPEAVIIHGNLSLYQKKQLSDLIASDLGIGKEAQQWNP